MLQLLPIYTENKLLKDGLKFNNLLAMVALTAPSGEGEISGHNHPRYNCAMKIQGW